MSTSPVGPEDIRAAAEVHSQLGPEYSDAVIASFLDKVEAEVAARVAARLAAASPAPAAAPSARGVSWFRRRPLAAGIIVGACAGGLLVGAASVARTSHAAPPVIRQARPAHQVPLPPRVNLPQHQVGG